jgi:hypothetical protein
LPASKLILAKVRRGDAFQIRRRVLPIRKMILCFFSFYGN